jgi:hypothetical protein
MKYYKALLVHHAQLHVSNVVRRQLICKKSQQRILPYHFTDR